MLPDRYSIPYVSTLILPMIRSAQWLTRELVLLRRKGMSIRNLVLD